MNCFPCFQFRKSLSKREHGSPSAELNESKAPDTKKQKPGNENRKEEPPQVDVSDIAAQAYTFRELATATRNFRQECLLGEGGFGRVYKGSIPSTGQVVAVKQLDRNGMQGNKEFLAEVSTLSKLNHPNLVNLIGYCADGDQRLLVYEYMSGGSVQDHLLDVPPGKEPLDWFTRMKIAYGAALGLEYLHDKADPPIIYRDLKPSNILLNEELAPKLSDFGLANLGPAGDRTPVPSRVMGTYGYSAPEYVRGDQLTLKSDVYSFGVILLELITGRRAIDTTKPIQEQNLVTWAQPIFREPKRFPDMADPVLNKRFPEKDLNQAVAIAAMCLQEESGARPLMSDLVTTLSFLSMSAESLPSPLPPSTPSPEEKAVDHDQQRKEDNDSSDSDHDGKGSESDPEESGSDQEDEEHEDHDKDNERGEEDEGETSDKDYTDSEDGESEDHDEDKDSDDDRKYDANESKNWGTNSMTSAEDISGSSRKSSSRKSSSRMGSSSRKSSDYNASLRHKSSRKSHHSLKSKRSKRSKSRSSSSSSEASQDGTASLRHKSSRISRSGSNSSDGDDSGKGSEEGSVYSSSSSNY